MEIPAIAVCLLGIGASLKYAYKVIVKNQIKAMGACASTLYLSIIYAIIHFGGIQVHGGYLIRLGIVVLLLDKILVFGYELLYEMGCLKSINKLNFLGGKNNGK